MQPSDISRWQGVVNSWLGQGCAYRSTTVSTAGAVINDTEGLAAGYYDFIINLTANVDIHSCTIQHRNAINDDNLYLFACGAMKGTSPILFITNWKISASERLRIVTVLTTLATYRSGIQWVKRA